MIAVLVGDQDSFHGLRRLSAQRFEAPHHFFAAETCINEESCTARLEQRAVARASRRQNGYSKGDWVPQSGSALRRTARRNREDDGKLRRLRQQQQFRW